MGRRSRKRRPGETGAHGASGPPHAASAAPRGGPPARVSRSEARNAEVRARLEPFSPDERPIALLIAAALAALIGLGNLAAFLAGVEVSGRQPAAISVVFLAVLFLAAAYGMWQKRYWAVLGFEVILGFTVAFATLSLLVAENVEGVLLCVALIGLGGWLFWKLVRVMSRIQVPRPGGGQGTGLR